MFRLLLLLSLLLVPEWVGIRHRRFLSLILINEHVIIVQSLEMVQKVHLDMNKRTCAFTDNGTKYPEVSAWNNLPSKLYPVVSLCSSTRIRIQPYRKFNFRVRKFRLLLH